MTTDIKHAQKLANSILEWGHRFSASRLGQQEPFPRLLLPVAWELVRDLEEWEKATAKPRLGLYGASQAGKSTFVERLLRPETGVSSPFATLQPISYLEDINPPGGGLEATAVITRFVGVDVPEQSPVLTLGDRRELISVLTAGFHLTAELEEPGVFAGPCDLESVDKFLERHGADDTQHSWPQWRDDILHTYLLASRRVGRIAFPIEFQDLFVSLHSITGLNSDWSKELAGMLFWRGSVQIQDLFKELCESRLMSIPQVEVPWSALRLVLSRVLAQGQDEPLREVSTANFGPQSWGGYGLVTNDDGSMPRIELGAPNGGELDGLLVHAFATELRVPLDLERISSEGSQLLGRYDLVDFPGARKHPETYTEQAYSKPAAKLGLVERGRIDHSFLAHGAVRPLDVLVFLQKYGTAPEAKILSGLVGHWLKFWKHSPAAGPGIPPSLFAGVSHFDSVIDVLGKAGAHDLERFFQQEFSPNFPEWAKHWVGGETPFEQCCWLAMSPRPIGELYVDGPEREKLQLAYKNAEAIRDWIGDPEEKWNLVFNDPSGGVNSLINRVLAVDVEDLATHTYNAHLSSRVSALMQLVAASLPAEDEASVGADRAKLARELSEGYLDRPNDPRGMLKAFARIRNAFEVPAQSMTWNPNVQSETRIRLWHRDLINSWAVHATKHLTSIDSTNAEDWTRLVGWLKEALRLEDLEAHFISMVRTPPRSALHAEGGADLFPRFAASLIGDMFFRTTLEPPERPEPKEIYDSSEIPWKEMVFGSFVESVAWLAQESVNIKRRVNLPGDSEGVVLLGELRSFVEALPQHQESKG